MKKVSYFFFIGVSVAFLACTPDNKKGDDHVEYVNEPNVIGEDNDVMADHKNARAEILNSSGSELKGEATFKTNKDGKVEFKLTLENVAPGEHAVHLHENGDCSAADASSAGGHWNPTNEEHGKRGTGSFHKGDIGNVTVGDDGKGEMEMIIEGWSIGGNADSNILDKAVIIHAGADDFTSQPSGAAGDRIGCGVIVEAISH
ncbi:MAG: superoxide dismutase family protein [Cyclobacteriaceae bacterium]|nr:superoxide dismutase family protein [Cyclobacteriaceae bacterium]